jgi:hypothetical protein
VIRPARPAHRTPLEDEVGRLIRDRDRRRAARHAAGHALHEHAKDPSREPAGPAPGPDGEPGQSADPLPSGG